LRGVLVLLAIVALALPAVAEARDFPRDFLWGTALLSHLRALRGAMRDRLVRVKGYFAWSLVDNYEWAAGYYSRFGFFSYDPDTLSRRPRPSARLFRRIARSGNLP
jgi:beta-glucosidase/6-phospho-beta-glucosidase/beta-galactosidase